MYFSVRSFRSVGAILATAGAVLGMQSASAQTTAYSATASLRHPPSIVTPFAAQQAYAYAPARQQSYESIVPEPPQSAGAVPAHLRRQIVNYPTREAPGTIIVDTPNTYLYYVLGGGKAVRYGIGVGREGFTWSGVGSLERKDK
jgi:lipoprotein-anchoring transpeptidase ErfK/SrfK